MKIRSMFSAVLIGTALSCSSVFSADPVPTPAATKPVAKPVPAPVAAKPAPAAVKPAAVPVAAKPAAVPVAAKPAPAAVKPAAVTVAAKPVAAAKPVTAPVAAKPIVVEKSAKPAPAAVKPAAIPAETKPASVPAVQETKIVLEEDTTDIPAPVNDLKTVPAPDAKPVPVRYKRNYPIVNLVITANYQSPRLLAEMARKAYRVPYVLIPAGTVRPDESMSLAFIPADASGSFVFKAKDLSQLIAYIRPHNVVILGSDSYVHPLYRLAVPSDVTLYEFKDADWSLNALKLANQLNQPKLYRDYRKALENKNVMSPDEAVKESDPGAKLSVKDAGK